jgi:hypothetical protein
MHAFDDTNDVYILNGLRFAIAVKLNDDILHGNAFRDDRMRIPVLGPIPQFQTRILVGEDLPSTNTQRRGSTEVIALLPPRDFIPASREERMAGCSMATSEGAEASECGDAGRGGDLVAWTGPFPFRAGGIVGLVSGGMVVRWKGRLLQAVAITTYATPRFAMAPEAQMERSAFGLPIFAQIAGQKFRIFAETMQTHSQKVLLRPRLQGIFGFFPIPDVLDRIDFDYYIDQFSSQLEILGEISL